MSYTNGGINKIRLDELIKTTGKFKESNQSKEYTQKSKTDFYLKHKDVFYQAKEDYVIADCSFCLKDCDKYYLANEYEQNKMISCFEYFELIEITEQRLILELLMTKNYYEVTLDLTK